MAQLHGQIVSNDGERIGIVKSVASVTLNQPDRVTRDADSGEELARESRPPLEVAQVTVAWEDGSESALTECLDTWTVLGSVEVFPEVKDPANPPAGAFGELPEQRAATDAAVARVEEFAAELRDAAPLAAREVTRNVEVVDDGELSIAE